MSHLPKLAFLIVTILVFAVCSFAQSQPQTRRVIQGYSPRLIPEASLPCSPEEAKWWEDLRKAGNAAISTRNKKDRQQFSELLQEGLQKAFKPPVSDMKPIVLYKTEPSYTQSARVRRINGTIVMGVEFRADGFIGDVQVESGLGYGLDENAAEAARHTVYLPAVKNGQFVSSQLKIEMNFNIY